MDFDSKLQLFATTTFLGGRSLIVTLYTGGKIGRVTMDGYGTDQ